MAKPQRVVEMEGMMQKPEFQGYEKQIPGFETAMQGGNVQECLACVRDFLMKQQVEPDVKQYLLEQLDTIEQGVSQTPQGQTPQQPMMEQGVYNNAGG